MLTAKYKKTALESEEKANRYTASALLFCEPVLIVILILNELRIFHCDKAAMRISFAIAAVLFVIPYFLVKKHGGRKGYVKYVIVFCTLAATLIVTWMLSFHVTLMYLFPCLIAVQYDTKNICVAAVIGCCICAIVSPVMSLLTGMWDSYFLEYLVKLATDIDISAGEIVFAGLDSAKRVDSVILYITLPRILTIAAFSPLIFAVNNLSHQKTVQQLEVIRLSETDLLTGLLNRNSYETAVSDYDGKSGVSVVYIDVNGLHEMNNSRGHEAGDEMLRSIAGFMRNIFGGEYTYRTGGDEFVSIFPMLSEDELADRTEQLRVASLGCHYNISIGTASSPGGASLEDVVKLAEQNMYRDKEEFYRSRINESGSRRRIHSRRTENSYDPSASDEIR